MNKQGCTSSNEQKLTVLVANTGSAATVKFGKLFDTCSTNISPASPKSSAKNAVAALVAAHSPTRANLHSTGKIVNLNRILPCMDASLPFDN